MCFPKFIEQIRKGLSDPNTPILHIWYVDFAEKRGLYQSRKETGEEPVWEARMVELDRLRGEIARHNRDIDGRYIASVLEQFKRFSTIQAEIRSQFADGYVIVGYKGIDIERAARIYEEDLDCSKTVTSPAGASRGEGFYTSPHFATALDFAKFAARSKVAEKIPGLREPEPSSIAGSVIASANYQRDVDRFERRKSDFESTDEWRSYGVVARIYVKGFFAMHGCRLLDQKQPLPADWANFDYVEGSMQGGSRDQWEIKFNKHEPVYTAIRVFSEPRVDFSPDIPLGSFKMLEAAHFMLAKAESFQQRDEPHDGPS